MRYLIINTKNYLKATGDRLDLLFSSIEKSHANRVRILVAVPAFDLRNLYSKFGDVKLLTQHLDDAGVGSTTGWLVPEIARLDGASGSILNHSEHRISLGSISKLTDRLRELRMTSVVCARSVAEVSKIAPLAPDFIAIEPPELIGTGRAVSKYSPMVISRSAAAMKNALPRNAKTKLLCGAGIVSGEDVARAIELGSDGVLVASGVVLAKNVNSALADLLIGFSK